MSDEMGGPEVGFTLSEGFEQRGMLCNILFDDELLVI
jgi:hypothetical protein